MAITDERLLSAIKDLKLYPNKGHDVMLALTKLTSDQYMNNFLFVYGSLRKDEYNYKRIRATFGKDSFIYIEDRAHEGLKLYDLGDYPAVIPVLSYSQTVQGEVMYCSDEVFKVIKDMEEEAGYQMDSIRPFIRTLYGSLNMITIPYYKANKNLQKLIIDNDDKYPRVESGDWSRYIKGVVEKK